MQEVSMTHQIPWTSRASVTFLGGPVEICSGVSALAYSMMLGKRQQKMMLNFRPHNVSLVTLGTIILWFGWLGFNGGSAFGANLRAVMACWNSCLTAMMAAITWVLLDYRLSRKWSMVGWVSALGFSILTHIDNKSVLRLYLRARSRHPSFRIYSALGFSNFRGGCRLRIQLLHQTQILAPH
jgi:hypothetical protein